MPLKANYDVLGGMPMVMVNAESLDEIMADKVLAFPTSLLDNKGQPVGLDSAKIRHRDIWDLAWMATRGAKLVPDLVVAKIKDYGVVDYPGLLASAIKQIPRIVKSPEFKSQMTRFVDSSTIAKTLGAPGYEDYLASSLGALFSQMRTALDAMPVAATARASASTAESQADAETAKPKPKIKRKRNEAANQIGKADEAPRKR